MQDQEVHSDQMVLWGLKEQKVHSESQAQKEIVELKVLRDHRDQKDQRDPMD